MDEVLHQLELKIKQLLEKQTQLQQSNASLNILKESLVREKNQLQNRQHMAVNQLKSLVIKLKALERLP